MRSIADSPPSPARSRWDYCRFRPAGRLPNGLIHKNRQDAVVKLALFAYDAKTRQLVWESNTVMECGYLDRQYLGTANIGRQTSLPELESYPPRRVR